MSEIPGFVYILGNEAMPGIYKIGHTTRHPKTRAIELSKATGCPTPFELLAYFGHEYPQWCEKEIHRDLDQYRVNSQREFFRLTPSQATDIIRGHSDPFTDCVFGDEEHVFITFEYAATKMAMNTGRPREEILAGGFQ